MCRRVMLAPEADAAVREDAALAYPNECCGALLGRDEGDRRTILAAHPLANAHTDSPRNRFLIAPRDVLAAERTATRAGLELLGFYHSHPDHPARPSQYDLEHAWPWYTYLIVAVGAGRPEALAAWELRDDRSQMDPVGLESLTHGTWTEEA